MCTLNKSKGYANREVSLRIARFVEFRVLHRGHGPPRSVRRSAPGWHG
jgi:hypothetical protein